MRGGTHDKTAVWEEEDTVGTEGTVLGQTVHINGCDFPIVEADGCEGARPTVGDNKHPTRIHVEAVDSGSVHRVEEERVVGDDLDVAGVEGKKWKTRPWTVLVE